MQCTSKINKNDQEMPQLHTAAQPTTPLGRDTAHQKQDTVLARRQLK